MSSNFLEKSNFNSSAASVLIKQHCNYGPSIHCSYYSIIQYILHIIFYKIKISKEDFEKNREQVSKGTHKQAISIIRDGLKSKKDIDETAFNNYKYYKLYIAELKLLRERADYYDEKVTSDDGHQAFKLLEQINIILKSAYK